MNEYLAKSQSNMKKLQQIGHTGAPDTTAQREPAQLTQTAILPATQMQLGNPSGSTSHATS